MLSYISNRLVQLVPVLFLISLIVFSILHALPGDPAQLMLAGAEGGAVTPERIEELREQIKSELKHELLAELRKELGVGAFRPQRIGIDPRRTRRPRLASHGQRNRQAV